MRHECVKLIFSVSTGLNLALLRPVELLCQAESLSAESLHLRLELWVTLRLGLVSGLWAFLRSYLLSVSSVEELV